MHEVYSGLMFPPFQIMPDSRFYLSSIGHSRALAHVTSGLAQSGGLIVVTGEIGAGKMTLVEHLLTQLDPGGYVAVHIVTSQLSLMGLLRMILAAFKIGCGAGDKAKKLCRYDAFCHETRAAGVRILLIVDEVQNLPFATLEELRMLSNLTTGGHAPQTCLIGQPQFLKVIQSPRAEQLRQRICTSYHLGVLQKDKVGEYVQHPLHVASRSGDPSFDDDVFPAVHAYIGRVPRRINLLCSRLLLRSYLNEAHRISHADVCEVANEWRAQRGTPSADDLRATGKERPKIALRLKCHRAEPCPAGECAQLGPNGPRTVRA